MAYDAARGVTVLFGGGDSSGYLGDTWESYTPVSWPDEVCTNAVDDDSDGLVSCDDPDCDAEPTCAPVEVCTGGADDDGDGLFDCEDPNCGGASCGGGLTCIGGLCQ